VVSFGVVQIEISCSRLIGPPVTMNTVVPFTMTAAAVVLTACSMVRRPATPSSRGI
jgi:hypothetical protein